MIPHNEFVIRCIGIAIVLWSLAALVTAVRWVTMMSCNLTDVAFFDWVSLIQALLLPVLFIFLMNHKS